MLLNLHKKNWTAGLTLTDFNEHSEHNEGQVKVGFERGANMLCLACLLMNCALVVGRTGNVDSRRSIQQIGSGRNDDDAGATEDSTCWKKGPEATFTAKRGAINDDQHRSRARSDDRHRSVVSIAAKRIVLLEHGVNRSFIFNEFVEI